MKKLKPKTLKNLAKDAMHLNLLKDVLLFI